MNEVDVAKILTTAPPPSTGAEWKCRNSLEGIEKWLYLFLAKWNAQQASSSSTGNRERLYPGACSLWVGDKAQSNEDLVFCFSFCEVLKWPQLRSCSLATLSGVPEVISPWPSFWSAIRMVQQSERGEECQVQSVICMESERVISSVKNKSGYNRLLLVTAKG